MVELVAAAWLPSLWYLGKFQTKISPPVIRSPHLHTQRWVWRGGKREKVFFPLFLLPLLFQPPFLPWKEGWQQAKSLATFLSNLLKKKNICKTFFPSSSFSYSFHSTQQETASLPFKERRSLVLDVKKNGGKLPTLNCYWLSILQILQQLILYKNVINETTTKYQ